MCLANKYKIYRYINIDLIKLYLLIVCCIRAIMNYYTSNLLYRLSATRILFKKKSLYHK